MLGSYQHVVYACVCFRCVSRAQGGGSEIDGTNDTSVSNRQEQSGSDEYAYEVQLGQGTQAAKHKHKHKQ
jgi:hypothetical protein